MEYLKFQTPSTKSQTNLKFQYQMTETGLVRLRRIGHWDLFGICDLLFEILILILQNSLLSFPAMFE